MIRVFYYCLLLSVLFLTGCVGGFDARDAEKILTDAKVYPQAVEFRMFCNSDEHVQLAIDKGLVNDTLVTVQHRHTLQDMGKPLIYFTAKAAPYLIATDDTLRSIDVQRVRMAEEKFGHVRKIEINPKGDKAVVDYTVLMINPTPFIVLYDQKVEGEHNRRTFFTMKHQIWTWDGRIVRMMK